MGVVEALDEFREVWQFRQHLINLRCTNELLLKIDSLEGEDIGNRRQCHEVVVRKDFGCGER